MAMIIKAFKYMSAAMLLMLVTVSAASAVEPAYTLEDAYKAALGMNEIVMIAEENVVQAERRVDQAWTYLYPHLTAQSSYTWFNEELPPGGGAFIFQPLSQFSAALVLTQPLYTGGRTLAGLRTAKDLREASRKDFLVTSQDVMLSVADAYYGVLKAEKLVDVSRRALERMERHKKVTEREAATRKTKANISALLRANTLVNQARIDLVRTADGLKVAREKFNQLTKLPVDAALSEPKPLEPPAESLEQLKEAAFIYRDDYAVSKLRQEVAAENVTIVKGGHYPQFYAEGAMQYLHSNPETLLDGTVYYGGIRLQVPIFEGGLMKAEVSEARSKLRQADLSTEQLRRNIESEVYEAYVNLQTVTSVLETARLQMDYAKGNFDAVEGMYSEGLTSSLALIDAENTLSMAERELVNATYDHELAILRLEKAIGTLGKEG